MAGELGASDALIGSVSAQLTGDAASFVGAFQAGLEQLDLFQAKTEAVGAEAGAALGAGLANVTAVVSGSLTPLSEYGAAAQEALAGVASEAEAAGAAVGSGIGGARVYLDNLRESAAGVGAEMAAAGTQAAEGLAAVTAAAGGGAAAFAEVASAENAAVAANAEAIAALRGNLAALDAAYLAGRATEYEYVRGLEMLSGQIRAVSASAAVTEPQLMTLAGLQAQIARVVDLSTGAEEVRAAAGTRVAAATAAETAAAEQWVTLSGRVVTTDAEVTGAETARAGATEQVTFSSVRGERAVSRFGLAAMMMAEGTRGGVFALRSMSFALFTLVPALSGVIVAATLGAAAMNLLERDVAKAGKAWDEQTKKLTDVPPAVDKVADHVRALRKRLDDLRAGTAEPVPLTYFQQLKAMYELGGLGGLLFGTGTPGLRMTAPQLGGAGFEVGGMTRTTDLARAYRERQAQEALNVELHNAGLIKAAELQREANKAIEDGLTPTEKYAARVKELDQAHRLGYLDAAQYARALREAREVLADADPLRSATKDLTEQIAKLGMTAAEWAAYELALKGVGAEGQRTVYVLAQQNAALEAHRKLVAAGVEAVRATDGPAVRYGTTARALAAALQDGRIGQEGFNRALDAALAKLTAAEREIASLRGVVAGGTIPRLNLGLGGAGDVFGLRAGQPAGTSLTVTPKNPPTFGPENEALNELLKSRQDILSGLATTQDVYAASVRRVTELEQARVLTHERGDAMLRTLAADLSGLSRDEVQYAAALADVRTAEAAGLISHAQAAAALQRLALDAGHLLDVGRQLSEGLSQSAAQMIANVAASFGQGHGLFRGLGADVLGVLGNLAVSIGQSMIAFGTAGLAIKAFVSNPLGAILAGAGLVALGAALAAEASAQVQGAGTAGGYGGGGAVSYGTGGGLYYPSGALAQAAPGDLYLVMPAGKVFNPSDPRQLDDFVRMQEAATGRRVIVMRRG